MWIFTPIGFYSVVAARKDQPDHLMVRARTAEDLALLVEQLTHFVDDSAELAELDIIATPHADYPSRIIVRRVTFSAWISNAFMNLEYGNFKDEVAKRDPERAHGTYLEVWSVLRHGIDSRRVPIQKEKPLAGVKLDPRRMKRAR